MSPTDESKPLQVSPATLADLYTQLATNNTHIEDLCVRLDETNKRLGGLSCVEHAERLARLEARGEVAPEDPDAAPYRVPGRQTRPSEDIRAATVRATEEVTGRIDLVAMQATQRAADDLAKKQHEAALRELELKHAQAVREMELRDASRRQWLKLAVLGLGLLGVGGGAYGVKSWRDADAREQAIERAVERSLKRIETKAATRPPDAGE